jgi:hypothetical protein
LILQQAFYLGLRISLDPSFFLELSFPEMHSFQNPLKCDVDSKFEVIPVVGSR